MAKRAPTKSKAKKAKTKAKAKTTKKDTKTKTKAKAQSPVASPKVTKAKAKAKEKKEDKAKDKIPSRKAKDKEKKKEVVQLKTVIAKGGVVVDSHADSGSHVVVDGGKPYSCTLNKSDLRANNNKYYIIQLLKSDTSGSYTLFTRWGRVGALNGIQNQGCGSLETGKQMYEAKYRDKTRGGYTEIQIDYSEDKPPVVEEKKDEKKKTAKKGKGKGKDKAFVSKLSQPVIDFIKMIYNTATMNMQMKEIGYDSSKMPLGKLGKDTIEKAYLVLKNIENVLNKEKTHSKLLDLSSEFFSLIPHDFGFQKMANFIIDSIDKLKDKVKMLDSLDNMKIASKIISDSKEETDENKIIEDQYDKLHCTIRAIDKSEAIYDVLKEYLTVNNKKAYHQNLELLEAFELGRDGEEAKFNSKLKNHTLLWHGTRITNFVGILSQGLRIAPPEAPASGYLFGKGVYFADIASKSSMYCHPVNNIGLILLGEVALGNIEERGIIDSSLPSTMKKTSNSIHGLGVNVPGGTIVHDGIIIPSGAATTINQRYLSYNEFIVYNTNQVRLRYLLKMKYH